MAHRKMIGRALWIVGLLAGLFLCLPSAQAQTAFLPGRAPTPAPTPGEVNSGVSAGATLTNLGSNFLERLGDQASSGFRGALRSNPGGGACSHRDCFVASLLAVTLCGSFAGRVRSTGCALLARRSHSRKSRR